MAEKKYFIEVYESEYKLLNSLISDDINVSDVVKTICMGYAHSIVKRILGFDS